MGFIYKFLINEIKTKKQVIGMGYDSNVGSSDIQLFAMLLDSERKAIGEEGIIFYNNCLFQESVQWIRAEGFAEKDVDQLEIDFSLLPDKVKRILIVLNLAQYEGQDLENRYGNIENLYLRLFEVHSECVAPYLVNEENNKFKYYLNSYKDNTDTGVSLIAAELFLDKDNNWVIETVDKKQRDLSSILSGLEMKIDAENDQNV